MSIALRTLTLAAVLAGVAAAHADATLYYADATTGAKITSITAPAVGSSLTLAVYYTSTVALSDSEIFASYDTATSMGTAATPISGKVSLTSPVAATGVSFVGAPRTAGGAGTGTRPYGLDLPDVSATSGSLPATTTGGRLFTVTLNNLSLAAGQSATLSFLTVAATQFTSNLYDTSAPTPVRQTVTGTDLVVNAAPVPEPSTVAALGFGALAMLRRRKRA